MDARRALPFLLLAICAISAASIIRNGRGGPNNIRRIRRINLSEYLVPPPPPRFHPPGRVARLVAPSTEAPGYFSQFMNWLNPFSSSSQTLLPPPPPPPPPSHAETSYPPKLSSVPPKFVSPSAPAEIYGSPSPTTYDKPPFPSSSHPEYLPANKVKNCNPCDKVPWMPIQHDEVSHSGAASFTLPQPFHPQLNAEYLPPRNHESYDAYHAASQEVRIPDFSFAPSLPGRQNGSFVIPLPNPHLYPGAMPPLFKAGTFNSVQAVSNSNSEYLEAPSAASSSVFEDALFTENGSFPSTAEFNFNAPPAYPPSSNSNGGVIHQEYINPGAINGGLERLNAQNYGVHGDLSPSDTQISHGHSDLIPDKQQFKNSATQNSFDSIRHQTSFDNSGVLIDQNLSGNYGISGPDQIPSNFEHQYNDLSSSANVAQDSRAPLQDGSSAKSENFIHFEKSPLLDFTHKDESRTNSSSIPPTSNAFINSINTEAAGTTLTYDDEAFETRHDITATESYFPKDHFQTIEFVTPSKESKVNDSKTQESNGDLHDNKALRGQDVSYIPPDQVGYLWPSVLSTTSKNAESKKHWHSQLNIYDDAEETLNENINVKSKDELNDVKKNKQVQVIIPYTSQYTPLPFHSSHDLNHERKNFTSKSNHDYFSEESRHNIKVTSLSNSSHTSPNISTLLRDIIKKPVGIKANNSIDVHKLQKNIDNWTIQEYSKGTTASTISSSSANPYLFPSKQIPDKYLTTTESVKPVVSSYNDVKTFTLAGFTFNDLDYKGSASDLVEGQRVKMTENSKSESSTEASTASTKGDIIWQGFSVDISPVDKERVYVVTPLPYNNLTTPKSNFADKKKEEATKETDRNSKVLETDTKRTKKKSNTFELIEKVYQVLPQAVNNLAVASTGPESVPLWGIMEHEEFASLDENEHESEDSGTLKIPMLYAGHSKVSRARR